MYTIHTTLKDDSYPVDQHVETQFRGSLPEVWRRHIEALEQFAGIAAVEKVQEEKHPLETALLRKGMQGLGRLFVLQDTTGLNNLLRAEIAIPKKESIEVAAHCVAALMIIRERKFQEIDEVMAAAILQATKGKGQRHGGDKTPFLEQPWVRLYKTHGLGFLLGQADKKYHEACGKESKEDAEREFLGAIVYLGMALLVLEGKVK